MEEITGAINRRKNEETIYPVACASSWHCPALYTGTDAGSSGRQEIERSGKTGDCQQQQYESHAKEETAKYREPTETAS